MARRKRLQREKDLVRLSDLYIQGMPQALIGEEMEVSQQTISNDLKALQKRWAEHTTRNLDEAKAEELAKIDRLELEYWGMYTKSQEHRIETVVDENKITRTVLIPKNNKRPFGDPAYLEGVRKCIIDRRALLGLDAPTKQQIDHDIKATYKVTIADDNS